MDSNKNNRKDNVNVKLYMILTAVIVAVMIFLLINNMFYLFNPSHKRDSLVSTNYLSQEEVTVINNMGTEVFNNFMIFSLTNSEQEYNEAKSYLLDKTHDNSPFRVYLEGNNFVYQENPKAEINITKKNIINLPSTIKNNFIDYRITYNTNGKENSLTIRFFFEDKGISLYNIQYD